MTQANDACEIKPVVVVPVHKEKPSPAEIISLRQCGRVLGKHATKIVAPRSLDLGAYLELLPHASELRVDDHWMASIRAYNRMIMSPLLYSQLSDYTHMLLHEPDAIVLRDDLDYWCLQTIDYIGAPWFEGYGAAKPDSPVIGVGNSGFSLHRLIASRRIVSSRRRWYPYRCVAKDLIRGLSGNRSRLRRGLKALLSSGQLRGAWQLYEGNCDAFWSNVVPMVDHDFKVAKTEEAVLFSWEVQPSRCMKMTRGKLPFGIHAWAKYDFAFLAPYLHGAGVELGALTGSPATARR